MLILRLSKERVCLNVYIFVCDLSSSAKVRSGTHGVLSNVLGLILSWPVEVYFTAFRRNVGSRTVDPIEQTSLLRGLGQFGVIILSCSIGGYAPHGFHPMARFEGGPELLHVEDWTTRFAAISVA